MWKIIRFPTYVNRILNQWTILYILHTDNRLQRGPASLALGVQAAGHAGPAQAAPPSQGQLIETGGDDA